MCNCHVFVLGVFTDQFIFRLNYTQILTPQEALLRDHKLKKLFNISLAFRFGPLRRKKEGFKAAMMGYRRMLTKTYIFAEMVI